MDADGIAEVSIDGVGRLHVLPREKTFPTMYREGLEISWSAESGSLHSPPPRGWSYARWFEQILDAAQQQGCRLSTDHRTRWVNVPNALRDELLQIRDRVS